MGPSGYSDLTYTEDGWFTWSKPKELMRKCTCGYRPMNPCVVYEKHTETLFLFFIYVNETESWQLQHHQNKARLCYMTKKKNEEKWSEFTEVTNLVPVFKNWSTFAIGPGHGIQTKAGRMIVPAYAYTGPENERPIPHAFCFYSDDYGRTWKCEEMLSETSTECQMTEIVDSSRRDSLIYCNARTYGGHRVQAKIDKSGFRTLTTVTPLTELNKGCHGTAMGKNNSKTDKQRINKHTIFKSKGGEVFRIPAIYYDENAKTLFAFAEKRTSTTDSDAVALVLSTGKLNIKKEVT
ncbi:hypothetical protein CCH79_00001240, partial [Gambusia affinis]